MPFLALSRLGEPGSVYKAVVVVEYYIQSEITNDNRVILGHEGGLRMVMFVAIRNVWISLPFSAVFLVKSLSLWI